MITSASLVNLAPLLNVALMGFIVALGPLSWVWLKTRRNHMLFLPDQQALGTARNTDEELQQLRSRQRLLLLSQITLFLTFDLLIFGAFTRLTDSGLGCPDWPGCYGHGSPSGADAMIEGAQALMPTGPVTHVKAWIEMIHRYLATGVGVLILTIALFTVSQKYPKSLKVESMIILLWVCVQGAFGAFTVTMRLFPAVVTMHLLGAIVLLILLTRFAMAQRMRTNRSRKISTDTRLELAIGGNFSGRTKCGEQILRDNVHLSNMRRAALVERIHLNTRVGKVTVGNRAIGRYGPGRCRPNHD